MVVCTMKRILVMTLARTLSSLLVWQFVNVEPAFSADWPMWRYDANRSAASPVELPAQLHLRWRRQLPPPRPAFPDEPRLCFDASYEPVVMNKTMFVPSMVNDSITAFDTGTGVEKWKFRADGPVRFAPVAWKGKVYFVSDDGYLYCLDAGKGRLIWKFMPIDDFRPCQQQAGVKSKIESRKFPKLLGNQRLIHRWPARGGPVLDDGTIYFAAGLFPFEGVYVCALDAQTGKLLWLNKDSGLIKDGTADHSTAGIRDGGLSPQGYLAVIGEKLIVPSGKALPCFFNRRTGKLAPYVSGWGGRKTLAKGCWYVSAVGKYSFQSGDLYSLATGARLQIDSANYSYKELGEFREPVLTKEVIYYSLPINKQSGGSYKPVGIGYDGIVACDIMNPKLEERTKQKTTTFDELWSLPSQFKVHIKAGSRLYVGGSGVVAAVNIPEQGHEPKVSWKDEVKGTPSRMLAADGKLFVVTREGWIYCFGGKKVQPKTYAKKEHRVTFTADEWTRKASQILKQTGVTEGYCLALGLGTGRLVEELARQSELHIIVVDSDAKKADAIRRKLDAVGLYGSRIHILTGDLSSIQLPLYMADLTVSENLKGSGFEQGKAFVEKLFDSMRPYGGVASLPIPQAERASFARWVRQAKLAQAEVKKVGDFTLLMRKGALPGSADWTHESANAGNTFTSKDQLVKGPFGVLWFGGSVDRIFPDWDYTHSKGPSPLVTCGRMFIMVGCELHATDIYTGRHLWKVALPASKTRRHGYNHDNYVALKDAVYVACGKTCLRLDPATGSKLGQINIPADLIEEEPVVWREIRIWKDCLIGTTGNDLLCMNRYNGKVLWKIQSQQDRFSFAIGSGKVFCVDYLLPARRAVMETKDNILTLDARSGKILWQTSVKTTVKVMDEKKAGKFQPLKPLLAYCNLSDILIITVNESTAGAFAGRNGLLLWSKDIPCRDPPSPWSGPEPPILHHNLLITHAGQMYDPQTGSLLPERLWKGMNWGARGCGRAIASEHLVTVRDAHASYFDLATGRQTFFRGVRSGCTNSLVPAGGLLNAPNFARGCSCNYPIYTSLALVHMPEAAMWIDD